MTDPEDLSRRWFLLGVGAGSAAMGALAVAHAILPVGPFSLVEDRRRVDSPRALPVNRSARQADVTALASDPDWRLAVEAGGRRRTLSLAELDALPQHREVLPIACVEGWTVDARWQGVRLADLLDLVGAPEDATVRMRSLQRRGAFATTTMPPQYARDAKTLVALHVNGERLDLDHGYPARIIAPGRPGVLQTKWLSAIEVV
ncbi:molybdopterin-dependent oxidoreductase [Microbacterium sp. CIAB417]|uniref:molybdopterin-dependent oxidoreductase n=1 Tax=Microbacterium sp. CIAB417 TaxID=2860287 RepID=UPI001FAE49E3|nr:molybdopterin-dependent oxidoreductase [Microbacterium sp. CIAB417]